MRFSNVNITYTYLTLFFAIGSIMTLLTLVLHMGNKDSMLYVDQLDSTIHLHKTDLTFKKRILTTGLTELTAKLFDIRPSMAFVILNSVLTVLNGIILGFLSLSITKSLKNALFGLFAFYLSFPILFSYFHPIYTYDEPLQYTFLLGSALLWIRGKKFLSFILIILATLTRETTLIIIFFYPFIFNYENRALIDKLREGILFVLVTTFLFVFYIKYFNWTFNYELDHRVNAILSNFGSNERTIEGLTSFFLVTGLPVLIILISGNCFSKIKRPLLLAILTNSIIVFLTANAREARLFYLPIVMFLPFAGAFIEGYVSVIGRFKMRGFNKILVAVFTVYIVFWIWFSFYVFDSSIGNSGEGLFKAYLFIYSILIFPAVIMSLASRDVFTESHQTFNKN